ncbi:Hsp20/alpha crystallin family protein [Plasticicumulans acidivorans]|uniref:HSP20 family molecular chaperone IbpA n=1 Tax=Plasticicumulans acidivorans TaxID=886464 RepID=A0A317MTC4_9GAMM|nr:Hsp20/alpha crystallin family protein [Plasticicumulans acidivorans]PWV60182.1 HSP20 family molecular chaperone IbpA [Plasticicumulans acidivorans]
MGKNMWVDAGGAGFGPANFAEGAIKPQVDIINADGALIVQVELPGVSEQDIRLSVHQGVLTVAGDKHPHNREEWKREYYVAERAFGAFRRSINLPAGLDEDNAEADFADGVLTVRFPRIGIETLPGKPIPIRPR